jgi:predicted  nucleic acid-binding Zn-ribbon protein
MGNMNVPPVGGGGSVSGGSNPAGDDLIAISNNLKAIEDVLTTDYPSKSDIQNQLSLINTPLSDLKAQSKGNPQLQKAVAEFSDAINKLNQTVAQADLNSLGGS